MSMDASFGRWLQQRRKALGMTQADLAQQVGCATVTIHKFEIEDRRPSAAIAERLAICLQIADDERRAFLHFARGEAAQIQPTPLPPQVRPVPAPPTTVHLPIPVPATPLLGREREVASVGDLLCRTEVRLVTLVGPGGVGKTRLAIQVAADLSDVFAYGAVFVALAPLADPSLVLPTIARTLGLAETGGQPLEERLLRYLRDKQVLLVLDNLEHLLPAAPLISTLLAAAPFLSVLVTSRAVLHLSGEHEFPVPPLALPDQVHLPPVEEVIKYAAIALFRARAQAVRADVAHTPATVAAVVDICRRLDGLPLAIELAAARVRVLSPPELLARLAQRLPLLTGGARDLPARQQTIRATIDWSHALLTAPEQALFRRLGVFVGGCTLAAAEAVCGSAAVGLGAADDLAVLDGLQQLLDNSLLEQRVGVDGEPRFVMLETIREYALEQLAADGQEAAHEAHARYFTAFAMAGECWQKGPHEQEWFARLAAEHDNLRAALHWLVERGEADAALRLSAALGLFWWAHTYVSEGRRWLEVALARADTVPTAARMKGLEYLGWLVWHDDAAQAGGLFTAALALAQELDDTDHIGSILHGLGYLALQQGDDVRAEACFQESLLVTRNDGNLVEAGMSLKALADLAAARGDGPRATRLLEEALAVMRTAKYTAAVAGLLSILGQRAQARGDAGRARACYRESLTRYREGGWIFVFHNAFVGLAELALQDGEAAQAARLLGIVDARFTTRNIVMDAEQHARYERTMGAVRSRLDPDTFSAAVATGRAMTLEEAVTEALEVIC